MTVLLGIFLLLLAVAAIVVAQGLRRVPADPPHKAVVTRFGKRTGEVKDEGWGWFFLYPWVTGAILVDMTRKNQDLAPQGVRTAQDMAEIEVVVSLTWQPDHTNLREYLNSGGEPRVRSILEAVVEEAVREFAADPNRRPNTWEDAIKMRREFIAEIVLAILGKGSTSSIPPEEVGETTQELRRGDGKLRLETLGIVLNRVNITSIQPKGGLAKAAELEAKEMRERKGEVVEVETDLIKAQQLMDAAKKTGEILTLQQAYQITMEWKTAREGHGFALPGIAPAVMELARTILGGRRP